MSLNTPNIVEIVDEGNSLESYEYLCKTVKLPYSYSSGSN